MKVSRKDMDDIFVSLGFPNCPKWSEDAMKDKVNGYLPGAIVNHKKLMTEDQYKTAKAIVNAKMKGEKIVITSGGGSDAGTKPSPKKTSSKKETPPVATTKKKKKDKKSSEKKVAKKSGPGVIDTLVDYLKEHSKSNPLTVDAAAKHLKKKYFKDKGIEQLTNTIRQQLSSQLKREPRSLNVKRAEGGGYFISKKG